MSKINADSIVLIYNVCRDRKRWTTGDNQLSKISLMMTIIMYHVIIPQNVVVIFVSADVHNIGYYSVTRVQCDVLTMKDKSLLQVRIFAYKNMTIIDRITCYSEQSCYQWACRMITNESIIALGYIVIGGSTGSTLYCKHQNLSPLVIQHMILSYRIK